MRNSKVDFRQDSTVCKACNRHLFRTEAVRCKGTCNGEFHAECFARHDWTCGKCKEENGTSKKDFDKLTSAIDDVKKTLAKTDAKIAGLQVETTAGKINDNIEISELKTKIENIHLRFDFMEKQMNSLKAVMSTSMTELKTMISGLESKIIVLTARQTQFDQIDISGIQDTLNNASHVIVTEMTRTLDRLLLEKTQCQTHPPTRPDPKHMQQQQQQQQQGVSKLDPKECLLEEKVRFYQTHHSQFKKQKQNQQQEASGAGYKKYQQEEETLTKLPFQQHQKTSRLQQLAAQFQLQ